MTMNPLTRLLLKFNQNNKQMTGIMKLVLLLCIIQLVVCLQVSKPLFNELYSKCLKSLGVGCVSLSISLIPFDVVSNSHLLVSNADSTGKFSTKLTAKRRYKPRIVKALSEFQAISSGKINEAGQRTLDSF